MCWSVIDRRVGTGKEQRLVLFAGPADVPRWRAVITAYADDLTSPLGPTDVAARNDDPVTDSCLHGDHLLGVFELCRFHPWYISPAHHPMSRVTVPTTRTTASSGRADQSSIT